MQIKDFDLTKVTIVLIILLTVVLTISYYINNRIELEHVEQLERSIKERDEKIHKLETSNDSLQERLFEYRELEQTIKKIINSRKP